MSQKQQIERVMEMDRQIRAGCYPNWKTLARALEVSERVIRYDRTFMVDRLGAPIAFDREHGGWYYTEATWVLPAVLVRLNEFWAFALSAQAARQTLGPLFMPLLESAMAKLTASLKATEHDERQRLTEHFTFAGPATPAVPVALLVTMHYAMQDRRRVRMAYFSANRGEHSERVVHPYEVLNWQGEWYVIAFDERRQRILNFHMGRIDADRCHVLDGERFERDAAFSLEAWLSTSFAAEQGGEPQDVVIRFDAYQARWVRERSWHPEQQPLETLPDDGVVVRFRTGALDAVRRRVLQHGPHAEVLAPAALRQAVAEDLRAAARLYGADAP